MTSPMPLLLPVTKARLPSSRKFMPALLSPGFSHGPRAPKVAQAHGVARTACGWRFHNSRLSSHFKQLPCHWACRKLDGRRSRCCGSSAFFLEGDPWRQAPNNFTTKVPAWVTNLPPRRRDGVDRGARGATLASPLPFARLFGSRGLQLERFSWRFETGLGFCLSFAENPFGQGFFIPPKKTICLTRKCDSPIVT